MGWLKQATNLAFGEAANQGLEVGGLGAGGVYRTRVTGWFTTCFGGFFFFGFLTSRLRASLFPMADSLPQVPGHS